MIFGSDKELKCKPFTHSNLTRFSDEASEQMNSLLYENFAKNAYDQKEALLLTTECG